MIKEVNLNGHQKIHTIKEIKAHSVLLENDKWYKYYQVMKVNVTERLTSLASTSEQKHVKALNELAEINKNIKIQRTLKREGLDLKNIIRKKRILRR